MLSSCCCLHGLLWGVLLLFLWKGGNGGGHFAGLVLWHIDPVVKNAPQAELTLLSLKNILKRGNEKTSLPQEINKSKVGVTQLTTQLLGLFWLSWVLVWVWVCVVVFSPLKDFDDLACRVHIPYNVLSLNFWRKLWGQWSHRNDARACSRDLPISSHS